MTEAKHTPGPWTVSETWSQTCGAGYSIDQAKYNEYSEEFAANKLVIEAAPDLLLVAKFLHQLWGGDDGLEKERIACGELGTKSPVLIVHEAADAAIKKAEGRA